MNQTLEDRVTIIRESFQAAVGSTLLEVSGSFRVDFDSGQTVYIYAETYDNAITARYETKNPDPESRRREVEDVRNRLAREICFVDISEFNEASLGKNRFVYTADIQVAESIFFHETIVVGAASTSAGSKDEGSIAPPETEEVPQEQESSAEQVAMAKQAISQIENVDSKMLRQSLDMMNLKRSSNVRLVLTRIFRDAVDDEELLNAALNEAAKLTSSQDHEELRIIKSINRDGFLEPVIGILCEAVFGKDTN